MILLKLFEVKNQKKYNKSVLNSLIARIIRFENRVRWMNLFWLKKMINDRTANSPRQLLQAAYANK